MKPFRRLAVLITCISLAFLSGCDQSQRPQQQSPKPAAAAVSLSIVSGSENNTLEPLLQQFAKEQNIGVSVKYMGSVDIGLELAKGAGSQFDAVWPASSLWLSLGDKQGVVKNAKSVMRSPVVGSGKTVSDELVYSNDTRNYHSPMPLLWQREHRKKRT